MQFYMENQQCIGRKPDGGLQFLGYDKCLAEAVARIEAARVANKCPNEADLVLVDGLMLVDATLMDDADKFELMPVRRFR